MSRDASSSAFVAFCHFVMSCIRFTSSHLFSSRIFIPHAVLQHFLVGNNKNQMSFYGIVCVM